MKKKKNSFSLSLPLSLSLYLTPPSVGTSRPSSLPPPSRPLLSKQRISGSPGLPAAKGRAATRRSAEEGGVGRRREQRRERRTRRGQPAAPRQRRRKRALSSLSVFDGGRSKRTLRPRKSPRERPRPKRRAPRRGAAKAEKDQRARASTTPPSRGERRRRNSTQQGQEPRKETVSGPVSGPRARGPLSYRLVAPRLRREERKRALAKRRAFFDEASGIRWPRKKNCDAEQRTKKKVHSFRFPPFAFRHLSLFLFDGAPQQAPRCCSGCCDAARRCGRSGRRARHRAEALAFAFAVAAAGTKPTAAHWHSRASVPQLPRTVSFIFLASQRLKEHRNELQFLLGGRTRNRRELKKGLPNTRKVVWVWLDGDDDDDDDDARDRPPSARGKNSQPRPLFPSLSIHHFKKKKKKAPTSPRPTSSGSRRREAGRCQFASTSLTGSSGGCSTPSTG